VLPAQEVFHFPGGLTQGSSQAKSEGRKGSSRGYKSFSVRLRRPLRAVRGGQLAQRRHERAQALDGKEKALFTP